MDCVTRCDITGNSITIGTGSTHRGVVAREINIVTSDRVSVDSITVNVSTINCCVTVNSIAVSTVDLRGISRVGVTINTIDLCSIAGVGITISSVAIHRVTGHCVTLSNVTLSNVTFVGIAVCAIDLSRIILTLVEITAIHDLGRTGFDVGRRVTVVHRIARRTVNSVVVNATGIGRHVVLVAVVHRGITRVGNVRSGKTGDR